MKKYPSSVRFRDTNSRPLEYESPTITTGPLVKLYTQSDLFHHLLG